MDPINFQTIVQYLNQNGAQTLSAMSRELHVTPAQMLRPFSETVHRSAFCREWPGLFNIGGLHITHNLDPRPDYHIDLMSDSDSGSESESELELESDSTSASARLWQLDLTDSESASEPDSGFESEHIGPEDLSTRSYWWIWPFIWLITVYVLTNPLVIEKMNPLIIHHHDATNHAAEAFFNYLCTVLDPTSEEFWWRQIQRYFPVPRGSN